MKKLVLTAAVFLSIAIVAACTNADGTAVVTGQPRAAISASEVQLYSAPPKMPFETIAIVKANSASGWSDQQSMDYAVAEIKEQAASVGANGVVIGSSGSQTGGFVMIDNVAYPYDQQTVSGTAIYVK
ncbi:hypothetical protein [Ruegeria atlantica]|uniref:hypothetical protein n=1 Tax=Ruegeria atlantica TaxID=81569 RepID=UPI002493D47B|nr:hypothetical protein [Ruegeria atlantica]